MVHQDHHGNAMPKLHLVPLGEPPAPPMRLRSMLPGVPECPEGWEPYFAKHERFISWGWDVACAVLEWEGGGLIAEHPVTRFPTPRPTDNSTGVHKGLNMGCFVRPLVGCCRVWWNIFFTYTDCEKHLFKYTNIPR